MDSRDVNERISRIETHWNLLWQAHQDPDNPERAALRQLLLRYHGAVYRYLLGTLRDPAAAEELTQEFAMRFLRGDFKRADPQRGRFRDFLRTALRHLAIRHWEHEQKRPRTLPSGDWEAPADATANSDAAFLKGWREELLDRAWKALAQLEQETGAPSYTVLRRKTERPEATSAEMAAQVSAELGIPFTDVGLRQILHRARKKFAALLVEEVARSLQTSSAEKVEEELIELGLLDYCRPALKQRTRPDPEAKGE